MFNPSTLIDFDALFNNLGTFYSFLDPNGKATIKNLWTGIFNGLEGLKFDLYQSELPLALKYSTGHLFHSFNEYNVIFNGDNKNITETFYTSPYSLSGSWTPVISGGIYNYVVTGVKNALETDAPSPLLLVSGASTVSGLETNPNTIYWTSDDAMDYYNVYGRTLGSETLIAAVSGATSYVDSGISVGDATAPTVNASIKAYNYTIQDDHYYMTIPTLSGYVTGQILTEGDDYSIENLKIIKFLKPLSDVVSSSGIAVDPGNWPTLKTEKFIAPSGLSLIPTLISVYFPAMGAADSPVDPVLSGSYSPFISGWADMAYYNKRKTYADHLWKLTYALTYVLRGTPTLTNLEQAASLFQSMPFSYYTGTVTALTSGLTDYYLTVVATDTNEATVVYQIPVINHLLHAVDDSVSQFDILCSGISIYDYQTAPLVVSGLMLKEGEVYEFDVYTENINDEQDKYKLYSDKGLIIENER